MKFKNKIIFIIATIYNCSLLSMDCHNILKITALPKDVQVIISQYVYTKIISGLSKKNSKRWKKTIANKTITGHADSVNCVSISLDNKLLVSGSEDETVNFWDITNPDSVKLIKSECFFNEIKYVTISSDKKYLALLFPADYFSIYDNETQKLKHSNIEIDLSKESKEHEGFLTHDKPFFVRLMAFLSNNLLLIQFKVENSKIFINKFFDISNATFKTQQDSNNSYDQQAIGNSLYAYDTPFPNKPIAILDNIYVYTGLTYSGIQFSDYSKYLGANYKDWMSEEDEKEFITELDNAHDAAITSFVFSPNGKYLISASTDGIIKIWFSKYIYLLE